MPRLALTGAGGFVGRHVVSAATAEGWDVVAFDPAAIADKATYEQPHQYAVGMRHVLVNGVPVLRDGEHTGATPGRALKGSGAGRAIAR